MASPSSPIKTTEPNRPHARPGEDSALEKEGPSKASGMEVKIPQLGQKELTKQTAKEFALIGKKLKSERVKPYSVSINFALVVTG